MAFLAFTLCAEIFSDHQMVAVVKSTILFPGLVVLIPCLMLMGGLGTRLAGDRSAPRICIKRKRMKVIAGLGILVLLLAVVLLNGWAENTLFDTRFYVLQGVEIIAGFTNLTLLVLNFKDGLNIAAAQKETC